MKYDDVLNTQIELARLNHRVTELLAAYRNLDDDARSLFFMFGNQYTSALRRSSMDLTRVLARLRK